MSCSESNRLLLATKSEESRKTGVIRLGRSGRSLRSAEGRW